MNTLHTDNSDGSDSDVDSEYGQITSLAVAFLLVVVAAIVGAVAAGYATEHWPRLVVWLS